LRQKKATVPKKNTEAATAKARRELYAAAFDPVRSRLERLERLSAGVLNLKFIESPPLAMASE
jgi:hypothetical protein